MEEQHGWRVSAQWRYVGCKESRFDPTVSVDLDFKPNQEQALDEVRSVVQNRNATLFVVHNVKLFRVDVTEVKNF
jgi:hypothetical protein